MVYDATIKYGTPQYDEAIYLRDLYLRQPLNLQFTIDDILGEIGQHHIGLFHLISDELIAVASLIPPENHKKIWKMRQVVVKKPYQAQGIGTHLIRQVENYVIKNNAASIYCHARKAVEPFYRALNYTRVGGVFQEVTIPHVKMVKNF